jgi:adenylate cyclase class IV
MKREIEVKYLLKDKTARDKLVDTLHEQFPGIKHTGTKKIISYFYKDGATADQILQVVGELFRGEELAEATGVLRNSEAIMVKCRSIDDSNYFTIKGTPAGQDPVHAVNRLEFEQPVMLDLEKIDALLNKAGIVTASKWSSDREYYSLDDVSKAEVEFVAGYGYKAELEIVINDGESADGAISTINRRAKELGLVEASQTLLGKMYAYYNQHWQEYFNTRNTFSDETWRDLGRPVN